MLSGLVKRFGLGGRSSRVGLRVPFKNKTSDKKLVIISYLLSFIFICSVAGITGVLGLFVYFSRDLPNPNRLLIRNEELSSKLVDRKGVPIYEVYGEKNRSLVQLSDVSEHIVHATLATEDATFYTHQGFSAWSMLRAFKNTLTGKGLQGGSTITQQVVKNALLTQERTFTRKIKEFILALQIEGKNSKDEIMQMYLNEMPYGGQNYGVVTASKSYFDKAPKDLTLAESAYLAGLTQRPSYYGYYGSNPDAGLDRKNTVLSLMHDRGWVGKDGQRHYITDAEYGAAKTEDLKFKQGVAHFEAPHFIFFVKQILTEMFGTDMVEQGGLSVTTSLDLDLQHTAEKIVLEEVDKLKPLNVGNGALVALDPKTGEILAMVGSKGYFLDPQPTGCVSGIIGENSCYFDPAVNVATSARQPGSSIKPITYATLLAQRYTAVFPFLDVPTKFSGEAPDKPYIPENYDGQFRGPMSLRKSLGNSLNIPAVKALKIAGIDNMINNAEKMGLTTLKDRQRYGLALTLGGGETKLLEMTSAYGTFANKGVHVDYTPILEVKDASGTVIYKHTPYKTTVFGEDVAFLISDILSDDGARAEAFGFNSLLNIPGFKVAVKTGTTDNLRDNYAMGYTPSFVVGVWVGNNNNTPMSKVASGVTGASPVWNRFISFYLNGKKPEVFTPPENVKKLKIDKLSGMLPFEDRETREDWFIAGTEPTAPSPWYKKLEICKLDKKIADPACRDHADTEVETFIDIRAELPEWQSDVDAWLGENYGKKSEYFPPRMVSALDFNSDGDVNKDANPVVKIVDVPANNEIPMRYRLKVEVSSPNDIDKVRIYMDDEKVTEDGSSPFGYNFMFTKDQIGKHKFKATAEDDNGNKGSYETELTVVTDSY